MRAKRPEATLLALFSLTAVAAACSGGGGGDDPRPVHPRGGSLVMTRTAVAGFDPSESLSGIGSFFLPPGPDFTAWPDGGCAWSEPAPVESPTATPSPTETPVVHWNDAGGSLTLRSAENALVLDRFEGPADEILYLTRADAQPDTFPTDTSYDLEIAGSELSDGIPAMTMPGAVDAPPPLGLYAPDFSMTPVSLTSGAALQLGWVPGDLDEPAMMRMTVSGSAGSATLTCVIEDDGFYEVPASAINEFPSGGGTLTLSRRAVHETKLAGDTWFDAETVLTEGGIVLLP